MDPEIAAMQLRPQLALSELLPELCRAAGAVAWPAREDLRRRLENAR